MLTFLRRIRKSLIDSGATRKYLLYAIGEILLVMIGILLALQVNNWNEFKKDRTIEKAILLEVAKSLSGNIKSLEADIVFLNSLNRSSTIILDVIHSEIPYNDSLKIHFDKARRMGGIRSMDKSSYENLKNRGFDLIRSDSLRHMITDIFENSIHSLESTLDRMRQYHEDYNLFLMQNFFTENFGHLRPIDYQKTISDSFYESITRRILNQRYQVQRIEQILMDENSMLASMIQDELKKF